MLHLLLRFPGLPTSPLHTAVGLVLRSKPTITVQDGTTIYYRDWANGQRVVFSHVWPLSTDAWEDQMGFLAERGFRCVAHDHRGHGRSSQPVTTLRRRRGYVTLGN